MARLPMHCPKCGTLMETGGREYRCPKGNMGLAAGMERDLVEGFIEPGIQKVPIPARVRIGGRWFCPRDGAAMAETGRFIACPACGRSLNEYVYRLIERHPHLDESGQWR
jgi:tRNA(Ile2) C34 agmatinyltransferase TiaS